MDVKERFIFTLDKGVVFFPEKRCLVARDSTTVELSENSYRFLLLLLKGETDKQSLINQVWAEQRGSVSESSYYGQLYLLRRAFNQVGLPHSLIKTIPRKGVKYIGQATQSPYHEMVEPEEECTTLPVPPEMAIVEKMAPPPSEAAPKDEGSSPLPKTVLKEWYHSNSWNIFVSALSVLAVCWLTTLILAVLFFWKG
ncbi:hypothetical protein PMPD1_3708 [Paramixta manurensis]|uniref:Transcriptional regulator n=1 Tax=Paramixta manurensis TaxID=2740817 RepID=A0A6M8UNW5_9GAMM|nr:hypothetical protein PMPD1_3708 [Erwiniaceae bacterium PD-1]